MFRKREEWGEGMREKGGRYQYCSHFVIMFGKREEWECKVVSHEFNLFRKFRICLNH